MTEEPIVFHPDSSVEVPGLGRVVPSYLIDPGVRYLEVCSVNSDRCFVLSRCSPYIRDLTVPGSVAHCFFSGDGNVAFLYSMTGQLHSIAVRNVSSSWRLYEIPQEMINPPREGAALRLGFSSLEDLRRFMNELSRLEQEDESYGRTSKLVRSVSIFAGTFRSGRSRKRPETEKADQV